MRVAMIGTGYVGLVSGACFSEFGHDVICVDMDKSKIDRLNKGEIPIYEPGLDRLVETNAQAGRLRFTTDLKTAVANAEAVRFTFTGSIEAGRLTRFSRCSTTSFPGVPGCPRQPVKSRGRLPVALVRSVVRQGLTRSSSAGRARETGGACAPPVDHPSGVPRLVAVPDQATGVGSAVGQQCKATRNGVAQHGALEIAELPPTSVSVLQGIWPNHGGGGVAYKRRHHGDHIHGRVLRRVKHIDQERVCNACGQRLPCERLEPPPG